MNRKEMKKMKISMKEVGENIFSYDMADWDWERGNENEKNIQHRVYFYVDFQKKEASLQQYVYDVERGQRVPEDYLYEDADFETVLIEIYEDIFS